MEQAARAEELKQLANKAVAKSDMAAAVKHLSEAIGLQPRAKELWSNRAFAWSVLGKHGDALADAQQCIALDPAFSKGYLRAGRALTSLGRCAEAVELLEAAVDRDMQDYGLQEALTEAEAGLQAVGGAVAGGASGEAAALAGASGGGGGGGGSGTSNKPTDGGLKSSYYYAAVGANERKLPMQAPQRIDSSGAAPVATPQAGVAAKGHLKEDLDRKGSDSYYYAHDRKTDFTVPTVPKKLNPDGSMTPWDGK